MVKMLKFDVKAAIEIAMILKKTIFRYAFGGLLL
jgi:hypothetical protein